MTYLPNCRRREFDARPASYSSTGDFLQLICKRAGDAPDVCGHRNRGQPEVNRPSPHRQFGPVDQSPTTFEAMEQAGHTRSTMTSPYTVVALTPREQAVRRVQERLSAVEGQLGLRMDPHKVPVEVMVIYSAIRPEGN